MADNLPTELGSLGTPDSGQPPGFGRTIFAGLKQAGKVTLAALITNPLKRGGLTGVIILGAVGLLIAGALILIFTLSRGHSGSSPIQAVNLQNSADQKTLRSVATLAGLNINLGLDNNADIQKTIDQFKSSIDQLKNEIKAEQAKPVGQRDAAKIQRYQQVADLLQKVVDQLAQLLKPVLTAAEKAAIRRQIEILTGQLNTYAHPTTNPGDSGNN